MVKPHYFSRVSPHLQRSVEDAALNPLSRLLSIDALGNPCSVAHDHQALEGEAFAGFGVRAQKRWGQLNHRI